MKRNFSVIRIIGLVLCIAIMAMAGCAKKSVVKGEAGTAEEKAAVAAAGKDVAQKEAAAKK